VRHLKEMIERSEAREVRVPGAAQDPCGHSPITAVNSIPGAAVLVFRDPDNIQLELFAGPPS
jgi:hypothetical protein